MDGLMLDSERVYTEANGAIIKRYGHDYTWDIKSSMMGKPEREGATWLLNRFPDIPLSIDEFITERRAIQDALWPTCQVLPGIRKLVEHLAKHKIPMAVATGSIRRNYNLKAVHHPKVFDLFENRVICGDDPRLKGLGKPRPDIFLLAAELLGREVGTGEVDLLDAEGKEGKALIEERARGLVLEDSTNGLEAGQRAGMKTIWVPDEKLRALAPTETYGADCILESLEQFKPEEWGLPPYDS
ncbi:hypothetical protein M407DRAFT_241533 [Tulasnella calospora MUT 4182]|uniref:Carbohydrate phosphatase n=1 Tax=Tulasnella calospora MUT 4182 TaxID=1051891 RepID=A0A0C3QUU7_9AGAM|nr:hypothetical protein M407DRAFT_241533 [Tulasnella calospora MUT 4182]